MVDSRSALTSVYPSGEAGVKEGATAISIGERRDRYLVQISGWQKGFASVCDRLAAALDCEIPNDLRQAKSCGDRTVFRVAPERLWITGPANDEVLQRLDCESLGGDAIITEIEHSRTVLRISGPGSDVLLNRGLPIDLDSTVFPANAFAQSAIHHIPVLIHRIDIADARVFDAYVTREYAVSFWEWLIEAAAPLDCEIMQPEKTD